MRKSVQGVTNPDAYLTSYSLRLMRGSGTFVAGAASTRVTVTQEAGKYNVYPPGYFWRDEARVRPLGGRPVQVGYAVVDGVYMAEEWALEHVIDDRTRANTRDGHNLDENGTELLTGKQMIRADRIWADKFFKAGVWGMQVSGVAAAPAADQFLQWNDAASNPITDIENYKERIRQATGMEPNTLVLGSQVATILKNHPDFIERVKYTSSAALTMAVLAALFEIENVRVARALYNSAEEVVFNKADGMAAGGKNLQYIVDPKAFLLAYIAPTGGTNTPTAIATFAWDGLVPGQTNEMGGVISRGRDDRAYSDYIHSRQAFGMAKISDDLAVFGQTVVA